MAEFKTIERRINSLCTLLHKPIEFNEAVSLKATDSHKHVVKCRNKLIKCGQKIANEERSFAKHNFVKPMSNVFPEIHNRKEMAVASKHMRKFMKKYHKEHSDSDSDTRSQSGIDSASSSSNVNSQSASSSSSSSSSDSSDTKSSGSSDQNNNHKHGHKDQSLFN